MVKGRIHSIETMGLVDGPGIRTVVFLQGCKLRCLYCHNPDTWTLSGGTETTPEDIVKKIARYKSYYDKSGGGVTFSGGECLLQPEFLAECLKLCKEKGIHTTIDTSGCGFGDYEEILKYTDLVILDVKHHDAEGFKDITGQDKKKYDEFLKAVLKAGKTLWIRHVVVPGITDSVEHIEKLSKELKDIKNIEKIELLPYHTLGIQKYEKLNIPYKLNSVKPMNKENTKELEALLRKRIG